MGFEQIIYEVRDSICTVTPNRPEKLNALTSTMLEEMLQALEQADHDDGVRAVIVTGAGRAFCAGADLGRGGRTFDRGARDGAPEAEAHRDGGGVFALRAFEMKKP